MRPIAKLLLMATLALVGCTATPRRGADAVSQERFDPKDYSETGVEGGAGLVPASLAVPMAAHERAATATGAVPLFPRSSVAAGMVIRTGPTSIEVDSLERAVAQVRLLAGRIGGEGAHTTQQKGPGPPPAGGPQGENPAPPLGDRLGGVARPRPRQTASD